MMQEQNCEPLPPRETAVLRTLFKWVHCIEFKMHDHLCLVGDVTGMVNEDLRHRHESFHMSPREVGAVLKCFGVDRRRTRWGWLLLFDRQLEDGFTVSFSSTDSISQSTNRISSNGH